ncbi:hypothetical protein [Shinella zoogloeoides]|uniref:Uncharacterized protein n=1 Tax=Shinella zoogloeoides TaxID=352475 RepID=A0A6N8TDK1_SHIZO|nr:hypothetical protein [Shinella zoogloeoides]MXO01332.1 hypothetical protein [Shinella zoogloeoides]UEX81571.1 hypothetical protein K8M09_18745 [Shinella zoogloeoides]
MPEDQKSNVIPFRRSPPKPAFGGHDSPSSLTDARKPVTSTKMAENNGLGDGCHRSRNGVVASVTVTENGKAKAKGKPGGSVSEYEATVSEEQWKRDVATMTKTQLRKTYPGTWQSFKNMRYDRPDAEGAIIDPSVADLADFMKAIGPRRHQNLTVDRIDTNNPTYAFGKIKWSDKTEQANNRRNNSHVRNPRTNEWGTVAQVAAQVGRKPNTITVALGRALKAEPDRDKHEAIRSRIVGECLLRAAEAKGHDASEIATSEAAAPAPMPDYDRVADPTMRLAYPVSKEERQAIYAEYDRVQPMETVRVICETEYGSYTAYPRVPVSRFDFSLGLARGQWEEARRTHWDFEDLDNAGHRLTDDQEAAWARAKEEMAFLDTRIMPAVRARPAFLVELAEHVERNGRSLTAWEIEEARRIATRKAQEEAQSYRDDDEGIDEEDRAMKHAERFGTD